jgi:hypothetical protein
MCILYDISKYNSTQTLLQLYVSLEIYIFF